ncbi:MFS transporter [Propionibacterium freudenreichii]|nr:MFS transporter [Propionibacterium freudenreichii]
MPPWWHSHTRHSDTAHSSPAVRITDGGLARELPIGLPGLIGWTIVTNAIESRTGESRTRPNRGLIVAILVGVLAIAFEAYGTATAMPAVAGQFHRLDLYDWAFTIFTIAQVFAIVIGGRMADRTGVVVPLVAGSVIFGIGLLGAGASPSMHFLLAMRGVQGFGGGALNVALMVLVAQAFGEEQRQRLMTAFSFCWVLPSFAGPPIAAAITEKLSWHWVFWGLLPILVAAVVLGAHLPAAGGAATRGRVLRRPRRPPRARLATGADLGGRRGCRWGRTAAVGRSPGGPHRLDRHHRGGGGDRRPRRGAARPDAHRVLPVAAGPGLGDAGARPAIGCLHGLGELSAAGAHPVPRVQPATCQLSAVPQRGHLVPGLLDPGAAVAEAATRPDHRAGCRDQHGRPGRHARLRRHRGVSTGHPDRRLRAGRVRHGPGGGQHLACRDDAEPSRPVGTLHLVAAGGRGHGQLGDRGHRRIVLRRVDGPFVAARLRIGVRGGRHLLGGLDHLGAAHRARAQ